MENCSPWEAGSVSATGLPFLPPNLQSGNDCGKEKRRGRGHVAVVCACQVIAQYRAHSV